MQDFNWQKLKRPISVMAPMADVTDIAFRQLIAEKSLMGQTNGGPDAMWTEFVSVDGLLSTGKFHLLRDLQYQNIERPIIAQLFGSKSENFFEVAKMCLELGFDGIDINMGCPDDNVCKQGAGSALIKNKELAKQIITATKKGADKIPVSVKTRLGWNTDETETWIRAILEAKPDCLTIHARTKKEMSKSEPKWESIKRAVEIKNEISPETIILANGSIRTKTDIVEIVSKTNCDGVMMGKAIFGNPWLFQKETTKKTVAELLDTMIYHGQLFSKLLGETGPETNNQTYIFGDHKMTVPEKIPAKSFAIMRKHFKAYCFGFSGAKELRIELMQTENILQTEEIIKKWKIENPEIASGYTKEEYIV